MASHVVHTLAHELDDEQAGAEFLQHRVEVVALAGAARGQHQVVRAARIAGGLHAELARRIAAEEVALHAPGVHHLARLHAHAFLVERRTAFAAKNEGVFKDVDVLGKHRLAQRVEQKAALAVQRAAARGLHIGTEQARRQGRLEQHRAFGGGYLAAAQAAQGALRSITAHGGGRGQLGGAALRAVPGVTLHLAIAAGQRGDGGHREAVARGGVAAPKAPRVRTEKMALLRRYRRTLAVGDALAGGKGRGLAFKGYPCGLFAGELPGVKKIEVAVARGRCDVIGIGQAGHRVFGSKPGNVVGGLHGALDGGAREVGGARIAAPVADVDRHAERLVAVALHGFQLALAHAHRQATALGGLGAGIGGAELFRVRQRLVHELFKKRARIAEARVGGGMRMVHGDGYDTCR